MSQLYNADESSMFEQTVFNPLRPETVGGEVLTWHLLQVDGARALANSAKGQVKRGFAMIYHDLPTVNGDWQ